MILDPPVLPFKKFSPRRTILVATFLLTGILLSIIYLTFTFTFRTKENEHEKFNILLSLLALNLILSLNLFSQAAEDILLNEEFLDSLPEETKADLVEQLEKMQIN